MASPHRPLRCVALALLLILGIPLHARAQTPVASLDDLRRILKESQTIVVTETSGRRIKGTVRDVLGQVSESSVAEVRTSDRVWNGALIGAGVGTGLALWDYLIDPSEPGNGPIFAFAIGTGAAIGAGIDAWRGGRVVYRAGTRTRTIMVVPLAARTRRGVQVAVRF